MEMEDDSSDEGRSIRPAHSVRAAGGGEGRWHNKQHNIVHAGLAERRERRTEAEF